MNCSYNLSTEIAVTDIDSKTNTPGRTRTCDLRIRNPLSKNDNSIKNKDLLQAETIAYKPAYKNISEIAENKTQIDIQKLPTELADIVTIWHKLPEHIKAAIKALAQTHNTEKK